MYDSLEGGFGMKVLAHLRVKEDGGAGIDEVEHLNNMLLLADHGSAGTVLASLKSNWISSSGSRGSKGFRRRVGSSRMQPCCRKIFQTVLVERGRGAPRAYSSGSRGK